MAPPKKKTGARKSRASHGPDLEVVEVRYHPAPDALLRLHRAFSIILQAASQDSLNGDQGESGDGFEGMDDGRLER